MINSLIRKLMSVKDEELSQSTARVVITLLATIYFYAHNEQKIVLILSSLYLLYSILNYIHVYKYSQDFLVRKLISIFGDLTSISLVLILLNEAGSFFYPLYLWVIVGNGVRFGAKYLLIAVIYAAISFMAVLYFSDFWRGNLYLYSGLLFALVILPMFYFVIIRRLHAKNELLINELKHTTFRALHDHLTNIPNRSYFVSKLDELLELEEEFYLLFIDLDRFKEVNDTLGHNVGDEILVTVAKRFENIIGQYDGFVARLGGDEFAILIQKGDEALICKIAQDIIDSSKEPYSNGYFIDYLSASIGIVKNSLNSKYDIASLLKAADKAMYLSKEKGRDRFSFC